MCSVNRPISLNKWFNNLLIKLSALKQHQMNFSCFNVAFLIYSFLVITVKACNISVFSSFVKMIYFRNCTARYGFAKLWEGELVAIVCSILMCTIIKKKTWVRKGKQNKKPMTRIWRMGKINKIKISEFLFYDFLPKVDST